MLLYVKCLPYTQQGTADIKSARSAQKLLTLLSVSGATLLVLLVLSLCTLQIVSFVNQTRVSSICWKCKFIHQLAGLAEGASPCLLGHGTDGSAGETALAPRRGPRMMVCRIVLQRGRSCGCSPWSIFKHRGNSSAPKVAERWPDSSTSPAYSICLKYTERDRQVCFLPLWNLTAELIELASDALFLSVLNTLESFICLQ